MNNKEISPEEILESLQFPEKKKKKGRLKIFLGMAAGVGKTYAMLETAHKKVAEGVDVVVGVVETHKRSDVEKLLEGLTLIPKKNILYKEKPFPEFDLDKVIELAPDLVIVDEMASSNVPGSRHEKRWQDIVELLDAGIDVYSTLNIQHVESFKDIVEEITEIRVTENVPDLVLERATEIELIDLTPKELLERLKEGKVYTAPLSALAIQKFFQEDRLMALREMALLFAAQLVDKELYSLVSSFQKKKGWKPRERLLVAIDRNMHSQQLIRVARRRTLAMHAPWIVLYVDTGDTLEEEENTMLTKNLSLARQLGAEVIIAKDFSVAQGILRIAEQKEITEIIVGKEQRSWYNGWRPSLISQLLRHATKSGIKISVYTLSFEKRTKKKQKNGGLPVFLPYIFVAFWVGFISLCGGYVSTLLGYRVVGLLFLFASFLLGFFFTKGPLLFSTLLFTIFLDFFFVPPYHSLLIDSVERTISLSLFAFLSLIISQQTRRTKEHQALLIKRQQSTRALYEIVHEIANAPSAVEAIEGFKKKVGDLLQGVCKVTVKYDEIVWSQALNNKERAVAVWVLTNGQEAGWSTQTLSSAEYLHIPLKGFHEVVGVLSFRPHFPKLVSLDDLHFLHTVAQSLANYVERVLSEAREREHLVLEKGEKIYNTIFHNVSEALQNTINHFSSSLVTLKKEPAPHNPLFESTIRDTECFLDRLERVAHNMIVMEALGNGTRPCVLSSHKLLPLLSACTQELAPHLSTHRLLLEIPDTLPPFLYDFDLMKILVSNLLLNAAEYSPAGSTITVEAESVKTSLILSISDEGAGIPEPLLSQIFEKFYRAPGATNAGIGLGLSLASAIATLHNGVIHVHNRRQGGAKFSLILPQG